MNKKIEKEVMDAYADCHMKDEVKAMKIRNLDFRASSPVSVKEAARILSKSNVIYNEFSPTLLVHFPEDTMITIARVGSVCLYAEGKKLPTAKKVKADARTVDGMHIRYWWD